MATVAVAEGVTGTLVNGYLLHRVKLFKLRDLMRLLIPSTHQTNSSSSGLVHQNLKRQKTQNNITAISYKKLQEWMLLIPLNLIRFEPSGLETELIDKKVIRHSFVNSEGWLWHLVKVVTITAKPK